MCVCVGVMYLFASVLKIVVKISREYMAESSGTFYYHYSVEGVNNSALLFV